MTLTFSTDVACQALASYLKSALNTKAAAIDGSTAIVGIREYYAFPNSTSDFPLLMVYRTGSSGETLGKSSVSAWYLLPSMAELDKLPGILRWVETELAIGLQNFDRFEGDVALLDLRGMRSEYRFALLGNNTFPGVRLDFSLTDTQLQN